MRVPGRLGFLAAVSAVAIAGHASPAMAQFKDQLVQAPKLAAPERGSVAGALSGVNFTATELARGAFRLPLAIAVPRERGPLLANVVPGYSPDSGLSEWGMGWSVELSIRRHRLVGEIDYVDDELLSPWGRLRPGNDGNLYPSGFATAIQIRPDDSDWLAITSDGTRYRFRAASGVTTDRGVYSWQLTEVATLQGDRTTLEWTKNASGRPFLTRVSWGGRGTAPQYELTPTYEALATPFTDHTTGTALDQRVTAVRVAARDPDSGTLVERWHYQLAYQAAPFGPAFYLQSVQRVFASGQTQPAAVYRYELDEARLHNAPLEHYTGLDGVLQALGDISIQPDHAALQDVEADGVPDFEHAAELAQIQHADSGWTQTPLPAAADSDSRCRPTSVSNSNAPRVLARLTGDVGEPQVLVTRRHPTSPVTSTVLVCDRLGRPLADLVALDDWMLGPNTRLVDVDRDRRPDIVRVSRAGVDVLRNDSDAQGFRFTALPRFHWPLNITPAVTWLNDIDGDGNIDIVIRASSGLWVLFGLGNYQWTTTPQLFRFVTSTGSTLGSLDASQVTFVDANKDGLADVLLSQGINVWLYTNRGGQLVEVPIAGFRTVQSGFGLPIAADLTGRGYAEVVFPTLGTAYVVSLALPSTGLLASADDGMGTVLRFQYARSAPHRGIEQRITVLDKLTVESSGYDPVTYGYSYGAAVLHSTGKQLLGFDSVIKHSPILDERVEFLNDDDVAGLTSLSEDADGRTPGIIRFSQHLYDEADLRGVRWLRPAQVETGYRSPDGLTVLSTTTQYTLYERDFCPTVVSTTSPSGTLLTTTTLASVPALSDDFQCLSQGLQLQGSHGDSTLNFMYLASIARNEIGQVTQVMQMDTSGQPLVQQHIAYTTDHRLASISAAGRGTTLVGYDAAGRLASITDPVGITQTVTTDRLTDSMQTLATARPGAPSTAFFAYDGRERLRASWDDVSGSSPGRPGVAYTYQDATATAPARIDAQTLADAITGTIRTTVDLLAANGTSMVTGTWLGDHFALGTAAIQTRNTLTEQRSFIGTVAGQALTVMTSDELRALGTPLVETIHAGFGHVTQTTTTQQAGVVGVVTNELALTGTELITRAHEPGGFTAESAVDAAGKLIRKTDENGVVHRYHYDVLGRLVQVDTPDGWHRLRFDGFGRPASIVREGIGAVTYAYDPTSGLLTQKQHLDAFGAVVDTHGTSYDAIGRPSVVTHTAATDGEVSTLSSYYDGQLHNSVAAGQLGRLSSVRGDGWERSALFDALGRVYHQRVNLTGWRDVARDNAFRVDGSVASTTLTVTDPGGAVRFSSIQETELDNLGRISALRVDGNILYVLAYDDEGRLKRADFTSGEAITFDYDPVTHARRGHQVDAPAASGGIQWERDARGLVAAETYTKDTIQTHRAYSYDGRGALTRSESSGDATTYTYTNSGLPDIASDALGARAVHHSGDTLSVGDTTYTWDTAGRVSGKGDWTFRYGAGGQLRHASRPGRDLDFVYDDADQRLLKRVNGAPVRAEVDGGVLTEDHFIELVTIGGVVAGVLDNGQFNALLTDPRGTPFAGSDGTPDLASPYGTRASHLRDAEVIDYARLGWDPDLDIVRMGVRDYDPQLSQFLTPDPLYFENLDKCRETPLQCSLYGYAGSNPVSFVDPTGLGFVSFLRNVAADAVEIGATFMGAAVGATVGTLGGAVTGPGGIAAGATGAVFGAGLFRGLASTTVDKIRGVSPSTAHVEQAMAEGMAAEMAAQLLAKFVLTPLIRAASGSPKLLTEGGYRAEQFVSQKLFEAHFEKHALEWGPGNITQTGYLKRAQDLLSREVGGDILGTVRANGDVLRYNIRTNEFAVGTANGFIRTLFRPDGGLEYWLRQVEP